jgi:alpha-D-xyloside xylohydrolase
MSHQRKIGTLSLAILTGILYISGIIHPILSWNKSMKTSLIFLLVIFLCFFTCSGFQQKKNFAKEPDGVSVNVGTETIRLQVMSDKIIRVEATRAGESLTHKSLSVIASPSKKVKWSAKEESGAAVLKTGSVQAKIDLATGKIQFLDKSGKILLQENGREIIPAVVLDEKTNHVRQKFILSVTEALYGLGQHQEGNMNLRGKSVDLYQVNMNVSLPVLVSTNGYGILWDNPSLSKFTDNAQGMTLWSEVGDGIDYYFIAGKTIDEIISGYRTLTGQAPMYPKWAYGFFQSKERYQTQKEVLGIVDEFRKRQVPLDCIVQDWFYWDPQPWGSHYMNRDRYPDPAEMNKEIHENGAHIIISVWAKFFPGSTNYAEMDRKGYLLKPTAEGSRYYNPYDPGARALYWRQIRDSLFAKGFDGWWLDASEPEVGDLREDTIKKLIDNNLGTGARYLNSYPLMTTTAVYEGQRQTTSDKRVYILTRSAFPGQQRNAATTWSGDITASWDVFRKQIPAGLNFCFAGIPYWTTDIGGFFVTVSGGSKNDMYRELFTRWYEYGAFCPIFRVHGTNTPREIWRFGEPGDWSYDTQLKFDNLRHRLMPYIYSLGWKVTHDNYTIMRGLAFDFGNDSKVYNIDDQFMFGPALLVNPVTVAMDHPWVKADSGSIIPTKYLLTPDGKPGLTGEYYEGMDFDKKFATRADSIIDFNWGVGAPMKGMPVDSFTIRWTGKIVAPETGEYSINTVTDDGARLWVDGKQIIDDWTGHAPLLNSGKVHFEAGKNYDVKFEYYDYWQGAVAQLRWILPSRQKPDTISPPDKTRKVYLPGSTAWIDFWTGKTFAGGQTITAPAPIDVMPVYVKAGSIIPMGPYLQYATEKPADPIELRIYPGADGTFELYEDENDNYNYEKGKYAIIPFLWKDKMKTLTVGNRTGTFAGMLKERIFNVVLVNQSAGIGVEPSKTSKPLHYKGKRITIKMD